MQIMVVENKKRSDFIKRIFYLGSLFVIAAAILVYYELYGAALISGGGFMLWILFFQFADFQYISYSEKNNRIELKYYSVAKFGKKEYNSIDFPIDALHDAYFEKALLGFVSDLVLVVKTKRGVAEYPSVSFAAVKKEDILKIHDSLQAILDNK